MPTRRHTLGAGGLLLAGSGFRAARAEALVVEIRMRGDENGARVGFGPIRMLLRPGETVCWRYEANYHTNMANHQDHAKHPLHIPQGARPWASDVLLRCSKSAKLVEWSRGRPGPATQCRPRPRRQPSGPI